MRIAQLRDPASFQAQLFAAVYEQPEDRVLRSIYADWLQQHGDSQGELIALQLARGDRAPSAKERWLIEAHGARWVESLGSLLTGRLRFKKGLLSGCRCRRGSASQSQLDSPFWRTVESLEIAPLRRGQTPIPCEVWERASLPALRSAFGLHLQDLRSDDGLATRARGLHALGIAGSQGPKSWDQLLELLGEATELRRLDLLDCQFSMWQAALHILFDSELAQRIKSFSVHRPWISSWEFEWLLEHLPATCTQLELEIDGLVFWMDRSPEYGRWALELDLRGADPSRVHFYLPLIKDVSIHRRVRTRGGTRRVLGILYEFAKSEGLWVDLID